MQPHCLCADSNFSPLNGHLFGGLVEKKFKSLIISDTAQESKPNEEENQGMIIRKPIYSTSPGYYFETIKDKTSDNEHEKYKKLPADAIRVIGYKRKVKESLQIY